MPENDGYIIRARIRVDDAGGTGAASVKGRLRDIEGEGQRVSGRIGSMFQAAFAFAGGAAGLGALYKGVIGLNAPLQEASYGMATLLSAQTGAPITQALGVAKSLVGDLRKDAAAGAGELANYTEGLQMILGPGLGAGASLQQIRELNRLALGAGFALRGQEGLRYAPMDIQQALTSGTGDRTTPIVNQALSAVGMSQAAFNKLDPAKKIDALTKAFQAFGPGVELMGKSWSAQMSTLQDRVKGFLSMVTTPLFDRWSTQLGDVNGWLVKSADKMADIADKWGGKLVKLWDHIVKQAGTYAALVAAASVAQGAPGMMAAGRSAAGAMGGIFSSGAGSTFGAALKDPFGIQKLFAGALGGSTAGLTGGLGPGLAALGSAAAKLAWPLALITTAFLAVKGAISEYPETLAFVATQTDALWGSLMELGNSFGMLTGQGSLLNIGGAGLIDIFGGLVWVIDKVVRVIASLVTGLGVMFQVIGSGFKAMYLISTGRLAEASKISVVDIMKSGGDQLSKIWFPTEDNMKKPGDGRDGLDPKGLPKKQNITNINGPVKFELKTEQNADPARVMTAFSEGVDKLARFATQARRIPGTTPG